MAQSTQQSPETRELQRGLGVFDSTMIVVGSMIGSGIFIVSADISRTVGSPGLLLLVWILTGVMTVIGALSYGELAGMMPRVGGQYVYLREAYSPLLGFLYGWTLFLVIQTGTVAAVAVAFAKFTAVIIPSLGESTVVFSAGRITVTASQLVAISCIAVLTFINMQGLREGKTVQNIFTITKTTALLGLIVLGLVVGSSSSALSANLSNFWSATWTHVQDGKILSIESLSWIMIPAAIGAAMVGSLFSSDSWHGITFTSTEVINPKRTLPLSMAMGAGIVTLLYVLANVSYVLLLPLTGSPESSEVIGRGIQFASSDRVGTAAASVIFGDAGAALMAVLIMISTFGCNNGLILAGARVYYAMAQDGLLFSAAGKLNSRNVPAFALAAQGVWASLLCLSGTYSDLLDYVIFAVLLFYALTVCGIFVLRRKRPEADRPYKAFGYPVLPALYVVFALALCIDLLVLKPQYTLPGLGIVALGIPVYFIAAKRKSFSRQ